MPSVLYIGRLAKILISIKEGIIKKKSYERRDYESVDEKNLFLAMLRETTKKNSCNNGLSYILLSVVSSGPSKYRMNLNKNIM